LKRYDAVVIGGSVAGLLCAREVSSRGFSTLVLEEDLEIGVPEKCDGLVSASGIANLGVIPRKEVVQNEPKRVVFVSPSKKVKAEIKATKQAVVVLDRSRFDKQLAEHAEKEGADLSLGTRVLSIKNDEARNPIVVTKDTEVESSFVVDASGFQSLVSRRPQSGLLPAAQYLVEGSWFEKDRIEVYLDQEVSPGFFSWVIPITGTIAKVGVAGFSVNTFRFMDSFVRERGGKIIRRSASQVVVSGPIPQFVEGRILFAGDAAGQAKPTTAGGIYTGGMGGLLAGSAIAESLRNGEKDKIRNYELYWRSMFGSEFEKQMQARKVLSKLDNNSLEKLMSVVVDSGVLEDISEKGDFDMHSISLAKALGLGNVLKIAGIVASSEIRELLLLS
jgi:digeranylgeranylglycerophospholipid reductase